MTIKNFDTGIQFLTLSYSISFVICCDKNNDRKQRSVSLSTLCDALSFIARARASNKHLKKYIKYQKQKI